MCVCVCVCVCVRVCIYMYIFKYYIYTFYIYTIYVITVLHSSNIRSFYAYVNSCIHLRPASPQLINPSTPNSLNNDPNMVSNIFDKYFGSVDNNLPLLYIDTPLHGQIPVIHLILLKLYQLYIP